MAVRIKWEGKGHRNPSGIHNKVEWVLSKIRWDITNLKSLCESIEITDNRSRGSWRKVFILVLNIFLPNGNIKEEEILCKMETTWYKGLIKEHQNRVDNSIKELERKAEHFKKIMKAPEDRHQDEQNGILSKRICELQIECGKYKDENMKMRCYMNCNKYEQGQCNRVKESESIPNREDCIKCAEWELQDISIN